MMKIGRAKLPNRICISPGSYPSEISFPYAGAIFSKTITKEKNGGNSGELLRNIDVGSINRVGLVSKGLYSFLKNEFSYLKSLNQNVFVSVAGEDIEELVDMCAAIALECKDNVSGIELNLSCPNKAFRQELNGEYVYDAVSAVKDALDSVFETPLIVKLPPWPDHIAMLGLHAEDAGADAITATNTIKSLHFDEGGEPIIGGLSGEALKPIALRCVYELSQKVGIPIFGVGGISNSKDVVDFIKAGASAVQLCTAEINNPGALKQILKELEWI